MNISGLKNAAILAVVAAATTYVEPARASQLSADLLESFRSFVPAEGKAFPEDKLKQVDPSLFSWSDAADNLEIYFIHEGACYQNQLLYSVNDGALQNIFEDVSVGDDCSPQTLVLGEGRSLGSLASGSQVDFYLYSHGAKREDIVGLTPEAALAQTPYLFGAHPDRNHDGLQHAIAYEVEEWILLGFEDIYGGGDLDYNDTVFVVRGVEAPSINKKVPEPSIVLASAGVALLGMLKLQKRPKG